jgi:hypothetical protein
MSALGDILIESGVETINFVSPEKVGRRTKNIKLEDTNGILILTDTVSIGLANRITRKASKLDIPVLHIAAATRENLVEFFRQIGKEDEAERLKTRARRTRSNQ